MSLLKVFFIAYLAMFTYVLFFYEETKFLPSPDFNVGDCIAWTKDVEGQIEEWEKPKNLLYRKILKIGKENYLVLVSIDGTLYKDNLFILNQKHYSKVECPNYFKGDFDVH